MQIDPCAQTISQRIIVNGIIIAVLAVSEFHARQLQTLGASDFDPKQPA
jgi:hypothetical protein